MTKETMRRRTEGAWRKLCKRQAAVPIKWPFPPARLMDRLTRAGLPCSGCGRLCDAHMRWCPACAEVLP